MAWALKRLLAQSNETQFVKLAYGSVTKSNEGLSEFLLCVRCERRCGSWDEYASEVSRQLDGSFPARDALVPGPDATYADIRGVASLDCEALTRFAASIFWRTSAGTRVGFQLAALEDPMRRYLDAENVPFPANAHLILSVLNPPADQPIDQKVTVPSLSELEHPFRGASFLVWGLDFRLIIGSSPDWAFERLHLSTSKLAIASNGSKQWAVFTAAFQGATPRGALAHHPAFRRRR